MRRGAAYAVVVLVAVAAGILAISLIEPATPAAQMHAILAALEEGFACGGLTIQYPQNETLFPPEIVPPTFRWSDSRDTSDTWLVTITFADEVGRMNFLTRAPEWTPSAEAWEDIKRRSLPRQAEVAVLGVNGARPGRILSGARISIRTSGDEVGAPLFYREVNLPFIDAVKDPSHIRWRFGWISSKQPPPVVLEKLPVCGNCHSFSADGSHLGMDIDYANDKGSYVIAPVSEEMVLGTDKIITWCDYNRQDGEQTFGLLSQVSPDGQYVISTVKDRSVFVARPDLAFSQLFFPIKGILVFYRRQTRTFHALPGADDKRFVQSNPTWSPDGKHVVFARSKAYDLKRDRKETVLLTDAECVEFLKEGKTFLFDLYRIPFNDGLGGKAEPLQGASGNAASNYFAKYSPDGKWIVFCKAASFMLLQPDSELYIMPAEGGQPRRMRCNTSRMNSWHSWSPNGKWLVFVSKANTPYTQLFLTHVDEAGRSSPPVLLEHFTAPDRAANIPEFVNAGGRAIRRIREQFVDDLSFVRAALEFLEGGDHDRAEQACRQSLAINPDNPGAHNILGEILGTKGMHKEAGVHFAKAVEGKPDFPRAQANLGWALAKEGKLQEAVAHYHEALRLEPTYAKAHHNLGTLLLAVGKTDEGARHLAECVRLRPHNPVTHYNLAQALYKLGRIQEAIVHHAETVRLKPDHFNALHNLGVMLCRTGKVQEGLTRLGEAVRLKPSPEYHCTFAHLLAVHGQPRRAVRQYRNALKFTPDGVVALTGLASVLATSGDPEPLDGAEAVELAARACRLTANRDPKSLDVLGMGYAQSGRFADALKTADKALNLARAAGQEDLAREIRHRIALYKQARPYRRPGFP